MISRSSRAPALLVLGALLQACLATTPPPAPSLPVLPGASASGVATQAPASIPASHPPEGSAAPAGSVEPSAAAPAGPSIPTTAEGWQRVWPGPADPAAFLGTVLATSHGYEAAGADHAGLHPFALASTDGVAWATEAIPGDSRTPYALVPWADRLLAVGAGGANCAHPYGVDTWVRSADGTWSEAPFEDLLCGASDVHLAIVDDVPVLVGSGPGDNAVVWSSTDGLHWADHSGPFAGLLPRAVVTDGQTAVAIAEGPTATWASSTDDGSHWTRPAAIPGIPGGIVIDAAFWIDGAPTILASEGDIVGTIRPNGSGGWNTAVASGLSADTIGTITAFDGGLLAVGTDGHGPLAWVSSDGASWRPIPLPPDLSGETANVAGVAVRDGRAILVGSLSKGIDNAVSTIWTGSADLVLP